MPNFDKIFASQAFSGELVEMLEAQYRRGWGYLNPGEAPPMEFFNYFFNNSDVKAQLLAKIIGVWRPNETVYKGYIRKPTADPSAGIFAICQSEQGITGALEPNWAGVGTTAQDGNVTWEVKAVGSGSGSGSVPFGTPFPWPFEDTPPEGAIPMSTDILQRADYPELWERAEADGNVITDDAWLTKLAANGSVKEFSSGNRTATFRTPYVPAFIINTDDRAQIDDDGVLRIKGGGSGQPLGLPFPWPYQKPCPGAVPALGTLSSRAAFPQIWELIKDDVNMCKTEAAWQTEYNANSGCVGFYSSGTDGTNFRWPRIIDVFIRAGAANRAPGSFQGDAIRNITGSTWGIDAHEVNDNADIYTGPFYIKEYGYLNNVGTNNMGMIVGFDASRVVPTAAENRPRNIAYPWYIKAFDEEVNPGQVNLAQVINDVMQLSAKLEDTLKLAVSPQVAVGIDNLTYTAVAGASKLSILAVGRFIPDGNQNVVITDEVTVKVNNNLIGVVTPRNLSEVSGGAGLWWGYYAEDTRVASWQIAIKKGDVITVVAQTPSTTIEKTAIQIILSA